MNNKGSIADILWLILIVFIGGILFFTVDYVYNEYETKWINTTAVNETPNAISVVEDVGDHLDSRLDWIVFIFLVGGTLAIIITAWLVGGHAILTWIYFIMLVILVAVSSVFSHVWGVFSTKTIFGTLATTNFPITNFILNNFPMYIAIVGFLGMIIIFAKPTD